MTRERAVTPVEATVTWPQVLRWRMSQQLLDGPKARTAVTAARRLCGVHAQVAASAVAALDLRLAGGITSGRPRARGCATTVSPPRR